MKSSSLCSVGISKPKNESSKMADSTGSKVLLLEVVVVVPMTWLLSMVLLDVGGRWGE